MTAAARRTALVVVGILVVLAPAGLGTTSAAARTTTHPALAASDATGTVWLCRPEALGDPCTSSLTTTVVQSSGATSEVTTKVDSGSKFDCFYVYPTVSTERSVNANLTVQPTEVTKAIAQASRFSTVCRVWAPMYRQVTQAELSASPGLNVPAAATAVAYKSIRAAFEDYLAHDNHGRPLVFIGHSQGAVMLILLLERIVEESPALRDHLVLAIILGGNVEVRNGSRTGGTFADIPLCDRNGETGCVIAYSSFPDTPPADSLFGRPGQGVSLPSGHPQKRGLHVACVNPAALGGGIGTLDPFFPSDGVVGTPWVEYPDLYSARCENGGGATWLEVQKSSGASDPRPVVTETAGPAWGFHTDDVNLALGNLVSDVAGAEATWSKRAHAAGSR